MHGVGWGSELPFCNNNLFFSLSAISEVFFSSLCAFMPSVKTFYRRRCLTHQTFGFSFPFLGGFVLLTLLSWIFFFFLFFFLLMFLILSSALRT